MRLDAPKKWFIPVVFHKRGSGKLLLSFLEILFYTVEDVSAPCMLALAAVRRAIGTLYGEQLT